MNEMNASRFAFSIAFHLICFLSLCVDNAYSSLKINFDGTRSPTMSGRLKTKAISIDRNTCSALDYLCISLWIISSPWNAHFFLLQPKASQSQTVVAFKVTFLLALFSTSRISTITLFFRVANFKRKIIISEIGNNAFMCCALWNGKTE